MSEPTFYPIAYGLGWRVVAQGTLAAPAPPVITIISVSGTLAPRPVYTIQAYYDGGGRFASAQASDIGGGVIGYPAVLAVSWAEIPGARHYRLFRTLNSIQKMVYAGDGRDILESTTPFARSPFRFHERLEVSDLTTPRGRDVAPVGIPTAIAGTVVYVDGRPFAVEVSDAKGWQHLDLSGKAETNLDLQLVSKKRGLRQVVPVEFAIPMGSDDEAEALLVFNANQAKPEGPSDKGLLLHMTLNAGLGDITTTHPSLTTWREVELKGDWPRIGHAQRNMINRWRWDFEVTESQEQALPLLTPDNRAAIW